MRFQRGVMSPPTTRGRRAAPISGSRGHSRSSRPSYPNPPEDPRSDVPVLGPEDPLPSLHRRHPPTDRPAGRVDVLPPGTPLARRRRDGRSVTPARFPWKDALHDPIAAIPRLNTRSIVFLSHADRMNNTVPYFRPSPGRSTPSRYPTLHEPRDEERSDVPVGASKNPGLNDRDPSLGAWSSTR